MNRRGFLGLGATAAVAAVLPREVPTVTNIVPPIVQKAAELNGAALRMDAVYGDVIAYPPIGTPIGAVVGHAINRIKPSGNKLLSWAEIQRDALKVLREQHRSDLAFYSGERW